MKQAQNDLGWGGIFRLGLVQTALGAMVVLATSTFNRVMVVELALPAMIPGILVGLHYVTQLFRPRMGHGSDVGGRSTPWIIGGMAVLALGTLGAAVATAWLASQPIAGFVLALLAYLLIGLGVGAAGTNLLVLLAKRVAERRRGAAASVVWMMMIAGFAVTASSAGRYLDPYSGTRLVAVTASVTGIALLVMLVALFRLEGAGGSIARKEPAGTGFMAALKEVWGEPEARQFTLFVFVSMLAYSAQDLILEPFAGTVFGFTVGESTRLSGLQHQGVFAGMVCVAVLTSRIRGSWLGSLRGWTIAGCLGSAIALALLALGGLQAPDWNLSATVFALGFANGAFAVAAIGSMMANAGRGARAREGVRMGLWGAAQATAFGIGGFAGTAMSDAAHALLGSPDQAYAVVFGLEGAMFVISAMLAAQLNVHRVSAASKPSGPVFT
jgi:MFS transporter, BCD family, chlorophyll transporter